MGGVCAGEHRLVTLPIVQMSGAEYRAWLDRAARLEAAEHRAAVLRDALEGALRALAGEAGAKAALSGGDFREAVRRARAALSEREGEG